MMIIASDLTIIAARCDMNTNEVNPYIRLATHSVLTYPFLIKRRVIMDYELIYIESGEMVLDYDGADYPCHEGDILLLRPGIPHEFRGFRTDLSQPHIHFDVRYDNTSTAVPICFKNLPELSEKERYLIREDVFDRFPAKPLIRVSDQAHFLKLFYTIVNGFKDNPGALWLKILMVQLLEIIERENYPGAFETEKNRMDVCAQIKAYMKSNLYRPITLETIEKQFNYSKFYLTKRFAKEYGCSPIRYHNNLRMEHAKELLQTMSVSQVCECMHFGSVYAFSRAFRKHFHCPPSEARRWE